jgi:OmpA-OmpF porin, OOP family
MAIIESVLGKPVKPTPLSKPVGYFERLRPGENRMSCLLIHQSAIRFLLLAAMAVHVKPIAAEDLQQRVDYLSLARGALPVMFEGNAKELKVGIEQALLAIDGDDGGYILTPKPGDARTRVVFVFKLPALTTFNGFAVPNVFNTPSPSQTFVRKVEIAGSNSSHEGPFELLGTATLETHSAKGQKTPIPIVREKPVRWVRVTLEGGINLQRDKTFFEFSEIIGYGTQEPVPLSETFSGRWKGRGVLLELKQEGARVSGCYDGEGDINGTVSGNLLLRASTASAISPQARVQAAAQSRAIPKRQSSTNMRMDSMNSGSCVLRLIVQ